jgi:exodeoxyribonuclease VII small subunit
MAKIKNYTAAIEELEMILTELKSDAISIDILASKVERANELLAFCQELLRKTESIIVEK